MKSQINILRQLQELVLTRDEHHQTGDGSHLDALNSSIESLRTKLEPLASALFARLYKKHHYACRFNSVSVECDNCDASFLRFQLWCNR